MASAGLPGDWRTRWRCGGLYRAGPNLAGPMDLTVLAYCFTGSMYALALFRFRLFDLVPVARGTVIEQMREGMLILDREWRVMDVNPAAERILGVPATSIRAAKASRVFPACSGATLDLRGDEREITLAGAGGTRQYGLHLSPLKDRRGFQLGYVVLLHDLSEQKRVQVGTADGTLGQRRFGLPLCAAVAVELCREPMAGGWRHRVREKMVRRH